MRKIDLFLVNGALGAGKTTFLKSLLNDAQFRNARVVENETKKLNKISDEMTFATPLV